jgi:multidrug efflux pump
MLEPLVRRSWLFLPVLLACFCGLAACRVAAGVLAGGGSRRAFMIAATPEGSSFDYTVDQVLADRGASDAPGGIRRGSSRLLIRAPGWGGGEPFNQAFTIMALAPWEDRSAHAQEIRRRCAGAHRRCGGCAPSCAQPRSFGGATRTRCSSVVGGDSFEELAEWQEISWRELPRIRA